MPLSGCSGQRQRITCRAECGCTPASDVMSVATNQTDVRMVMIETPRQRAQLHPAALEQQSDQ